MAKGAKFLQLKAGDVVVVIYEEGNWGEYASLGLVLETETLEGVRMARILFEDEESAAEWVVSFDEVFEVIDHDEELLEKPDQERRIVRLYANAVEIVSLRYDDNSGWSDLIIRDVLLRNLVGSMVLFRDKDIARTLCGHTFGGGGTSGTGHLARWICEDKAFELIMCRECEL